MTTSVPAPLRGKSAIVTGASRGIGAAVAIALAENGCTHIAITYNSNPALAQAILDKISAISSAIRTTAIKADVFAPSFGQDVVRQALEDLQISHLDVVVSNAAYAYVTDMPSIQQASREEFDAIFRANVWSQMQLSLATLPHIRPGGRIINISSGLGKRANTDPMILYGASKAALESITRSMAMQYAKSYQITVNSVSVGPVNTDVLTDTMDVLDKAGEGRGQKFSDMMKARASAAERIGEPEDVANVVVFLAGPGGAWLNGNCVPCNGGSMLELQG